MSHEHPFAQYVRILGKGPNMSRPLTREETRLAAGMVLDGAVEPVQLGAFLCLMRVKTETAAEVAGFVQAARDRVERPAGMAPPDLDWSSYAGKSRQLPWFLLAALLLARNGIRVLMHGTEGHTAGRVYAREGLASLGIAPAQSCAEAARQLDRSNFAYLPLAVASPKLHEIIGLKELLGLRSPVHTIARNLNPFGAPASMMSVFHPPYREVHRDAARLLGDPRIAVFKGEGGEAERRPEKPCLVQVLEDGRVLDEEWPALLPDAPTVHDQAMDIGRLAAMWRGETEDAYATATVIGTTAVALRLLGKGRAYAEAQDVALEMWERR